MAKINRGILGGFSGSIANVTGGSWKGIAYMRSKPLSVANPNTAAQQTQRGKFASAVEFAQRILTNAIKPLWDRFVERQSGFNAWISANIDAFNNNGLDSPGDVVMSRGTLGGEAIFDLSGTNGNDSVGITFANNAGQGNRQDTDDVYAVVWNETQDEIGISAADNTRVDEAAPVTMQSDVATGDVLHAWIMFRRADGSLVSDSSYDTETV